MGHSEDLTAELQSATFRKQESRREIVKTDSVELIQLRSDNDILRTQLATVKGELESIEREGEASSRFQT
jgi:hypothetical protein